MQDQRSSWQFVIRALCVVALLAVGFGHRTPALAFPQFSAEDAAAMTLPDGTLPELCLPVDGQAGKGQFRAAPCDACVISASVLLPTPSDITGRRLPAASAVQLPPRVEAFYRQLFPPNAAPRAPPHPAVA
ncbi:MAG: hypothetical protein KUL88_02615 [Rhizobium sp.]|nr:hypothetical protein [Rhizobium sp.]